MPTESFRTNGTVLVTASVNGYFRIQGRVMRNYFVFRPSAPPSNFVTPTVVKQLVNLRSKSVLLGRFLPGPGTVLTRSVSAISL